MSNLTFYLGQPEGQKFVEGVAHLITQHIHALGKVEPPHSDDLVGGVYGRDEAKGDEEQPKRPASPFHTRTPTPSGRGKSKTKADCSALSSADAAIKGTEGAAVGDVSVGHPAEIMVITHSQDGGGDEGGGDGGADNQALVAPSPSSSPGPIPRAVNDLNGKGERS